MSAPRKEQPTPGQREMLKIYLYNTLKLNFNKLSKMKMFYLKKNKRSYPRSPQQFQAAFAGDQPALMNLVANYIRKRMKDRNGIIEKDAIVTNQTEVG